MPYVIVPIHGTWARGAKWAEPDSRLSTRLLESLDDAVLKPFYWSGKNSHRARKKAAQELRSFVCDLAIEFHGSQLFLVGHSHGGTVALYALEDSNTLARVAGLICLSTPFISVHAHSRFGSLPSMFPQLLASTAALLFGLALHARGFISIISTGLTPQDAIQYANIVCAFALTFLVSRQSVLDGKRVAQDLSTRPRASLPLLIMRCSGDEASAALAAAQFCTWITRRFWQRCSWVATSVATFMEKQGPLTSAYRFLTLAVVVAICTFAGTVLLGGPERVGAKLHLQLSTLFWISLPAALCIATYFVASSAIQLLVILEWLLKAVSTVVHPVAALFLLPFGPELAQASLVADISVEASPPGYWGVYQVEPSTEVGESSGRLLAYLHSSIYEHIDAIDEVCRWMSHRVELSPAVGGPSWVSTER
jgi:pimeloyl-ACP methyl ester carboxylesterase